MATSGGQHENRRGLPRRSRRQGLVPRRGRQRRGDSAALPARWPRLHPLLPRAARSPGGPAPGHLLRPARLRALGSPGRPLLVERGPVRGGTRPGPFGPQSRPPAPVRQLLGRHAGHAVRPRPARRSARAGEPDPVRQPGQHDPLGQRLHRAAGRGDRGDQARHPRARGGRLHRLPRVPGRHPGLFTASTYAASTRGRLAWSAPSPKQATTSTTR